MGWVSEHPDTIATVEFAGVLGSFACLCLPLLAIACCVAVLASTRRFRWPIWVSIVLGVFVVGEWAAAAGETETCGPTTSISLRCVGNSKLPLPGVVDPLGGSADGRKSGG